MMRRGTPILMGGNESCFVGSGLTFWEFSTLCTIWHCVGKVVKSREDD